jgi:DNA-directed RNA polymerase subunit RPC12/RpoP
LKLEKIIFRCPCNITLDVEKQWIGHELQCPNCGTKIVVPDSPDPENPSMAQPVHPHQMGNGAPSGEVTVMKWMEPSILKRIGNKVLHRWISVGMILGMGLFGILMRSISIQGGHPRSYTVVFLGCAAVGAVFDLTRRALLFIPTCVIIVSNQGINRNSILGNGALFEFLPWHAIGSGSVETVTMGFRTVRLLRLNSHGNEEVAVIGVARSVLVDQLVGAFAAMGKPLSC